MFSFSAGGTATETHRSLKNLTDEVLGHDMLGSAIRDLMAYHIERGGDLPDGHVYHVSARGDGGDDNTPPSLHVTLEIGTRQQPMTDEAAAAQLESQAAARQA